MRRRPVLFAAVCAVLACAAEARADELDKPNERRGGFAVGAFAGGGLAGSAGYPNDENFIGDPNYYSASGLMAGGGGGGFILGALTDYLSFGFWFATAVFENHDWRSTGEGGGLRLELFPLYGVGGPFRDLGVFTQAGIGGTDLIYKVKPGVTSDGVGSALGAGVFYEIRLVRALGGHVAAGPSLEYDTVYSQPMERHGALLGLRLVWYGGK